MLQLTCTGPRTLARLFRGMMVTWAGFTSHAGMITWVRLRGSSWTRTTACGASFWPYPSKKYEFLVCPATTNIYIYIVSSWSPGLWGPGGILSASVGNLQELHSWLVVGPLQTRTHIWNSATMVDYLENFLGEEIRFRRKKLGLGVGARCLIMCDCASQHSMSKFKAVKDAWCSRNNVAPSLNLPSYVILGCEPNYRVQTHPPTYTDADTPTPTPTPTPPHPHPHPHHPHTHLHQHHPHTHTRTHTHSHTHKHTNTHNELFSWT